jgi:methylenetetrahydrofolate reductase (NADPH)
MAMLHNMAANRHARSFHGNFQGLRVQASEILAMDIAAHSIDLSDERKEIAEFLSGFSLEVTPKAATKIEDFRSVLRPGTSVYITFLTGSDFGDTIALAERLRREGFNPVPHFAARSLPNHAFVEDALRKLKDRADIEQVLLIGGAGPQIGEYSDTMQLLATGLFDRFGIERIGVAGHPEGSPDIADGAIRNALAWKNDFANRSGAQFHIVTQFCFEAEPIIAWDRRIRSEGNRLPIHIGVPGLATIKTLAAHAKACGVGPSARFIFKQALNVAKLLTVSTPAKLIVDLARYRATDPECGISNVHLFPLGGIQKTADWANAVVGAGIDLESSRGFRADLERRERAAAQ